MPPIQTDAQVWRFSVEAGTAGPGYVILGNPLADTHRFRYSGEGKFVGPEAARGNVSIGRGTTGTIMINFDAQRLAPGAYPGQLSIECLDCRRDEGSAADRVDVQIEMTVTPRAEKAPEPRTRAAKPAGVKEVPVTKALLASITNDNRFKSSIEILTEQGETINLDGARALAAESGATEVSFVLSSKEPRVPAAFGNLVYAQRPGEKPFVYFDNPVPGAGNLSLNWPWKKHTSTTGGSGGNWPPHACLFPNWGPWVQDSSACDFAMLCVGTNQQAKFVTESRLASCPDGGTKTESRTRKAHCNC
jgi:hypothetical protein